jgi:hypothetical protein
VLDQSTGKALLVEAESLVRFIESDAKAHQVQIVE